MTVFDTVDELVARIRNGREPWQGEWVDDRGLTAWVDDNDDDRIVFAGRHTQGLHPAEEWAMHPAVQQDDLGRSENQSGPAIALAGWVLVDGALDAVLAAGVGAEYARAAHRAGVTDAWELIDAWTSGIAVEFLAALTDR